MSQEHKFLKKFTKCSSFFDDTRHLNRCLFKHAYDVNGLKKKISHIKITKFLPVYSAANKYFWSANFTERS